MLTTDPLWQAIRDEVVRSAEREPLLASFLHMTVLRHASFEDMLAFHLSSTHKHVLPHGALAAHALLRAAGVCDGDGAVGVG